LGVNKSALDRLWLQGTFKSQGQGRQRVNDNEGRVDFHGEVIKLLEKKNPEDWFSKEGTLFCVTTSTRIQETTRLPTKCAEDGLCAGGQQSDCQAGHSHGDSGVRILPSIFDYAYVAKHMRTGNDLMCTCSTYATTISTT
jgi:hypothetical protein